MYIQVDPVPCKYEGGVILLGTQRPEWAGRVPASWT